MDILVYKEKGRGNVRWKHPVSGLNRVVGNFNDNRVTAAFNQNINMPILVASGYVLRKYSCQQEP